MYMTFRWFGPTDPIPLAHIRQIPGVQGVVSALYDVPVGERWPKDRLAHLQDDIANAGLNLAVVESIPVHEDIKLGRPTRDRLIANYCESVQTMGELGVQVLCYNFMPVFDWMRTDLALPLPDGSTALAYDDAALARLDIGRGTGDLPGWAPRSARRVPRGARRTAVGPSRLLPRARHPRRRAGGRAHGDPPRRSTLAHLWAAAHHLPRR
jgi:mannonate dehydratase